MPESGRCPGEGNGYPFQYSCLERELCGQRSLVGYSPWGCKELDMTEWLTHTLFQTKTLRRVALFCIFVNLFNIWLHKRPLDSLPLHSIWCSITFDVASGKLYCVLMTEQSEDRPITSYYYYQEVLISWAIWKCLQDLHRYLGHTETKGLEQCLSWDKSIININSLFLLFSASMLLEHECIRVRPSSVLYNCIISSLVM